MVNKLMIDVDQAAEIAVQVLNQHFQLDDDEVVITDAADEGDWWVFQYNSRRYIETGDLMHAIVEGHPIAINKQDGSIG